MRPSTDLQHSPKLPHAELRIFAFRFYEAAVRGLTRSAITGRSPVWSLRHSRGRCALKPAVQSNSAHRPFRSYGQAGSNGRFQADFCILPSERRPKAGVIPWLLLGKRARAPLRLARHSISVTIHLCSWAVPQKISGFRARCHLGAIASAVTKILSGHFCPSGQRSGCRR